MGRFIDRAGLRYGRLTALSRAVNNDTGLICWNCVCDCGRKIVVRSGCLGNGWTKSCGCLKADNTSVRFKKHGRAKDRVYEIWCGMRKRCENPRSSGYPAYGSAGISVCDRWKVFENFLADMGDPPTDKHSIDRIDGSRGYCTENCRWADRKTQSRNRDFCARVAFRGTERSWAEIAEIAGVARAATIRLRVLSGWDIEVAATTPHGRQGNRGRIKFRGRELTLKQIARECPDTKYQTIWWRLKNGLDIESAVRSNSSF